MIFEKELLIQIRFLQNFINNSICGETQGALFRTSKTFEVVLAYATLYI